MSSEREENEKFSRVIFWTRVLQAISIRLHSHRALDNYVDYEIVKVDLCLVKTSRSFVIFDNVFHRLWRFHFSDRSLTSARCVLGPSPSSLHASTMEQQSPVSLHCSSFARWSCGS